MGLFWGRRIEVGLAVGLGLLSRHVGGEHCFGAGYNLGGGGVVRVAVGQGGGNGAAVRQSVGLWCCMRLLWGSRGLGGFWSGYEAAVEQDLDDGTVWGHGMPLRWGKGQFCGSRVHAGQRLGIELL